MNKPDDFDRWLGLKRDVRPPEGFADGVMREVAAREQKMAARPALFAAPAAQKLLYCAFALAMSALGLYRLAGAAFAILVP